LLQRRRNQNNLTTEARLSTGSGRGEICRTTEGAERTVDFYLKQILEWRKLTNMAKPASKDTTKDKLRELKAKRFTPEGREDRIARALEILSLPGPSFKVDKETWIWAAQEAEIEDS